MSQFFHKEDPTLTWFIMKVSAMTADIIDTSDMESQMYPSVEAIKESL